MTAERRKSVGKLQKHENGFLSWELANKRNENSDKKPELKVKMNEIFAVTKIVLNEPDFVKEFVLQYSDNGVDFRDVKDEFGIRKVFLVNKNEDLQEFDLISPIIAKVRFFRYT